MPNQPTPEEYRLHIIKRVTTLKEQAWNQFDGQQAFEYMARCQDFFKLHGARLVEFLQTKEEKDGTGKSP